MGAAAPILRLTEAENLERERRAELKSEFLDGALRLDVLNCDLPIAEVFSGVHFPPS